MPVNGILCHFKQKSVSLFLIITLLWLIISLPCFSNAQNSLARVKQATAQSALPGEDNGSRMPGNTEEKAASVGISSLSEEYLHHPQAMVSLFNSTVRHATIHLISFYEAFHGEMLCPPPNC